MNSAKQHVDEYKALATKTYANLQKFLESKGVKSVDEWLAKAQKELTPEEAAKVQKVRIANDLSSQMSAILMRDEGHQRSSAATGPGCLD